MQSMFNPSDSTPIQKNDPVGSDPSGSTANGGDVMLADVAGRAASEAVIKAAQSVRGIVQDGRALASKRIDATARWVGGVTRENPVRALGIVAIAGVVIGLLIGRR